MFFKKKRKEVSVGGKDTLLSQFSTNSSYAEAYRTLRTNLHFSLMDKELESLIVTSAVPSEGKSNTVANLAYTIALTGKKVLMVDADLRKPGLTARFAGDTKVGLSSLIADTLGKHLNEGNIADFGLKDLIKLCSLQRRTCVMEIADTENEAALMFRKGTLVDIYWQNRPESKKLANTLVRQKILTEDEANLALSHQKKSGRGLGSILLNMGFVSEKDLDKILAVHTMEAFRITTTTSMENGTFIFKPLPEEDVELAITRSIDFENLYNEFLTGESEKSYIRSAINEAVSTTEHENLFLLSSGKIPPNPSELIGSVRTSYLISVLKKKFDVVIIDTSPVIPASDALLLAPQTDGVLLVIKSGEANRKILTEAIQQLQHAKANILGVTLNQVDRSEGGYYKYYRQYYGS